MSKPAPILEFVRNRCEDCGERARMTKLQERNTNAMLCSKCFIERCEHPGKPRRTPQSGTEYCGKCGVAT